MQIIYVCTFIAAYLAKRIYQDSRHQTVYGYFGDIPSPMINAMVEASHRYGNEAEALKVFVHTDMKNPAHPSPIIEHHLSYGDVCPVVMLYKDIYIVDSDSGFQMLHADDVMEEY